MPNTLINTRWQLVRTATTLPRNIEFKEDGTLKLFSPNGTEIINNHKWYLTDDGKVIITLNNFYVKYVGVIDGDRIIGTATNVKRVTWKFEAKMITPNPLNSQSSSTNNLSKFQISGNKTSKHTYKYYALDHYYPVNKFPDVPVDVQNQRRFIFNFKDGVGDTYKIAADSIKSALLNTVPASFWIESRVICCVVPASNEESNKLRFENYCKVISSSLRVENGFSVIRRTQNKGKSYRGESSRGDISGLHIDVKLIQSKNILLFDDVMTTGRSFSALADLLMENGANEVIGVFLAKTYDTFNNTMPLWMSSNQSKESNISKSIEDGLRFIVPEPDDDLPF